MWQVLLEGLGKRTLASSRQFLERILGNIMLFDTFPAPIRPTKISTTCLLEVSVVLY
jgi:hypothetical protein